MSLLPQSKKSAEEIAKLRESLGIVGPPPAEDDLPAQPEEVAKADESAASPSLAPLPVTEVHEPKPVRSLKRSERISQLPISDDAAPSILPAMNVAGTPFPVSHAPKIVRSLRKSEQGPIAAIPLPSPDSTLPTHRHSDREIQEIRRQEAIDAQNAAGPPKSLTAHPALIVPGYLFTIAGAIGIYFYDIQKEITAVCVLVALVIAAIIFFKKPLSVHHAAFITVAALFVVVFGALHYFPQLRHGT